MKNHFLIIYLIFSTIQTLSGSIQISINSDELIDDNTIAILYSTDSTAIAGFQFDIDGADILEVSGGAAEENGFTVSTSSTTVLGFSLTGAVIPVGDGTLILVTLDLPQNLQEICLSSVIISDALGNSLDVEIGTCISIDCNGQIGGTAEIDCEGVCDGISIEDCNGVCNGDSIIDDCEVCDGNNLDMDCSGLCFGDAIEDCIGECNGNAIEDCAGECNGNAVFDNCGVCDDDSSNDCLQDCSGEWGGNAYLDECGICDNNPSNDCLQDCSGEWGGGATEDCAGICEGTSILDDCGDCAGNNYFDNDGLLPDGSCDCDGNIIDICEVCGGIAETLEDCVEGYGLFIQNVDQIEGTLDIAYAAEGPVSGFQFNLSDVIITGASGGISEQEGFTLSTSSETVLGFSLEGNSITPGSGLLVQVNFEPPGSGQLLCLQDFILSDPLGNSLNVEVGSCFELLIVDCNDILGGGAVEDECGICDGIEFDCSIPNACSCSGCTDPIADNYNADATVDDGTCTYPDFSGIIVINEIHYNPPGNTDQNYEFIEILNTSEMDLPLNDWTLSCSNSNWTLNIDNAVVNANGYLVFANNDETYPGSIEWPAGNMNNTTATIILSDNLGNIVDEVTYEDSWFGPNGPDDNGGYSLELISPNIDNSDSENWYTSFIEGGTPGESNSEIIYGCTDEDACNFDEMANLDDGSCQTPENNEDCEGNCLIEIDCLGVCGGTAELDCANVCEGTSIFDDCDECGGDNYFNENGLLSDGSCDCYGSMPDICGICGGMADDQSDCVQGLMLNIENVNQVEGTLDIIYSSEFFIGGFQFNLDGIVIISASGGLAEEYGFTINNSESTILGFSLEGNALPNGQNLMVSVQFEPPGFGTEVCLNEIVISNPNGQGLDFTVGPCVTLYEYDCNGELGGTGVEDECGICDGNGVEQECGCGTPGEFGIPNDACDCDGNVFDFCGICGGDGETEEDCVEGYQLYFGNVDEATGLAEIWYSVESQIAGAQFSISGAILSDASGGISEEYWTVSTSPTTWLGFSFAGEVLPSGINLLTIITFESLDSDELCLTDPVLSDSNGESLNVILGDCIPLLGTDCNGIIGGGSIEDECGICDGTGPDVECFDSTIVCSESDCPLGGVLNFGLQSGNTLEILLNSNTEIAGFEFDLEGADIISVFSGLADENGFTLNTANGIVLGFSLLGSVIPPTNGEEVLVYLELGGPQNTTLCFENGSLVLSGPGGEQLLGISGDCTDLILDISSDSFISDYNLNEAFPNPFNSYTEIQFSTPDYENINISIVDIHGQIVHVLQNGYLNQGDYKMIWNADSFSSGVYFIVMKASFYLQTQKVILVK